jgi:adenosylcobinamide-GDP ribazoletransferase
VNGFLDAVSFLTRVPVDRRRVPPAATVAATTEPTRLDPARLDPDVAIATAVPWFPVVGALVGLVVGVVYWGAAWALPATLAAALAVTVGVVLTGAFHEDGLADAADAFWGGYERERRLAILKDPRHGTYGVSALVLSSVVRVTALAAITPGRTALGALVAAHALGRGASVALMGTTANARDDGLASYVRSTGAGQVGVGLAVATMLGAVGIGGWVVPALVLAGGSTWIVRRVVMDKLGGIVGDVLGAVEQVVELAVLVLAAGVLHRGTSALGWWPA